jgi:hypothetical protein
LILFDSQASETPDNVKKAIRRAPALPDRLAGGVTPRTANPWHLRIQIRQPAAVLRRRYPAGRASSRAVW